MKKKCNFFINKKKTLDMYVHFAYNFSPQRQVGVAGVAQLARAADL